MNKRTIIQKIIAALAVDLESYTSSAKTAFAAATDEQSKAENKYDTRALEASYLARGQGIQALQIMRAIQHYETMPVRDFIAKAPIDLGALVELSRNGESTFYFVGPHAGGTELDVDGQCVLVITPGSPMAQQLMGKRCGDGLQIKVGRTTDRYEIAAVL